MPIIDLAKAYKGIEVGGLYLGSLERDCNQLHSFEYYLDSESTFDPNLLEEKLNFLIQTSATQSILDAFIKVAPIEFTTPYANYAQQINSIDSQIADLIKHYKVERNTKFLLEVKKLIDKRKEAINVTFQEIKKGLKSFKIKIVFFWKNCWKISFRKIMRLFIKVISDSSIDEDNALIIFTLKENISRLLTQLIFINHGTSRIYNRKNR